MEKGMKEGVEKGLGEGVEEGVGRLVLHSTEGAAEWQGGLLGEYMESGSSSGGRPVWRQRDDTGKTDFFLYYGGACPAGDGWLVGTELGRCDGAGLRNPGDRARPPEAGWEYARGWEDWQADDSSLSLQWGGLKPCRKVEVAGKGEVARLRGGELGSYVPTGSWLEGRPVYSKSKGGRRELRMDEGSNGWYVIPPGAGSHALLASGRGSLSPGDPAAGGSVRAGLGGWWYWGGTDWQDSGEQLNITCP